MYNPLAHVVTDNGLFPACWLEPNPRLWIPSGGRWRLDKASRQLPESPVHSCFPATGSPQLGKGLAVPSTFNPEVLALSFSCLDTPQLHLYYVSFISFSIPLLLSSPPPPLPLCVCVHAVHMHAYRGVYVEVRVCTHVVHMYAYHGVYIEVRVCTHAVICMCTVVCI